MAFDAREFGREAERPVIGGERLIMTAQHYKQVAAIAVQSRLVRPQIGRGAIALQRLLRPPQAKHDVGAVGVRFDRGGIDRDRAIEAGERLVGTSLAEQGLAQIDVGGGGRAIEGDRLPDQRDAFVRLPPLEPHHAEHMRGIEMRRLAREDFLIDARGGVEIALPMQRHSFPEARLQQAGVPFQG